MFKKIVFFHVVFLAAALFPCAVYSKSPINELTEHYTLLKKFNDTFGSRRSVPREVTEQVVLALIHGGLCVEDGKLNVHIKDGLNLARDTVQKRGTYALLHEVVLGGLNKAKGLKSQQDIDAFKEHYSNYIKPWVGDGIDFTLRGLKYYNDSQNEQSFKAYFTQDVIPYFAKKKTVWLTQRLLGFMIHSVLQRYKYGQIMLATHNLVKAIPLLGIEIEELPKTLLEYCYDKSFDYIKVMRTQYGPKIIQMISSNASNLSTVA